MAAPKRRTSKAKRDSRRSQAYSFDKPTVGHCPNCGEAKLPHRVCKNCGHYRGEEVIATNE